MGKFIYSALLGISMWIRAGEVKDDQILLVDLMREATIYSRNSADEEYIKLRKRWDDVIKQRAETKTEHAALYDWFKEKLVDARKSILGDPAMLTDQKRLSVSHLLRFAMEREMMVDDLGEYINEARSWLDWFKKQNKQEAK